MSTEGSQSDQDSQVCSSLKHEFKPIDNLPRNRDEEDRNIMEEKASLLIHTILGTGQFPPLIRKPNLGRDPKFGNIYPLCPIISVKSKHNPRDTVDFSKVALPPFPPEAPRKKEKADWGGLFSIPPLRYQTSGTIPVTNQPTGHHCHPCDIEHAQEILLTRSLFEICKGMNPRLTPQAVCEFLTADATPFSAISRLRKLHVWEFDPSKTSTPETQPQDAAPSPDADGDLIALIRVLQSHGKRSNLLDFVQSTATSWQFVYEFTNAKGAIIQQAVKLWDFKERKKEIHPYTCWWEENREPRRFYFVPYPGKQPLFNLHLLEERKDHAVILTDTVEIAGINQHCSHYIWTSFMCDEGRYHQVDFGPLVGRTVYLLVTNHSGKSFEEAYLDAFGLWTHLKETFEDDIDIRFIQVDVDFPPEEENHELFSSFISSRDSHPAKVRPDSVIAMSAEEFEKMHAKAKAKLAAVARPIYAMEPEPQSADFEKPKPQGTKLEAIDFLMRPVLCRGKTTILFAREGLGKTNVGLSLSASLVGQRRFLEAKWWTVAPDIVGKGTVLYLDFEGTVNENRLKSFVRPYLPDGKAKYGEAMSRLRIEEMSRHGLDLLTETGHKAVMETISGFEAEQANGRPVDLVVLDNYTSMVGKDHPGTWDKLTPLLRDINNHGSAVLLIDHANAAGELSGHAEKKRFTWALIDMHVDQTSGGDANAETQGSEYAPLSVPFFVQPGKRRDGNLLVDGERFLVKFTHKWEVHNADDSKDCMMLRLVKEYKELGFTRDAIAKMLGLGKSAYSEALSKAKKGRSGKHKPHKGEAIEFPRDGSK